MTTTLRLALVALLLSLFGASTASAQVFIAPTPPSRVTITEQTDEPPQTRPIWRAVAAGAGLLGGAWALDVVGTGLWALMPSGVAEPDILAPTWSGHHAEFFDWSLVPLIGPFMQMPYADHPEWQLPVLAIDGLLQISGLVTAIVGQVSRETVHEDEGPQISVAPAVSPQMIGLNAMGSF